MEHTYRGTDKEKKRLKLFVSGSLNQPAFRFTHNDIEIEEANAISILVFGRMFDELSQSEKSEMSGGVGAASSILVKRLLTGQLVGQITKALQRNFNLDVIEFKGEKGWRQASVMMGKYITNDLFLSYQREFSIGRSHEIVPEQVSLEYEINPYLFLQATKGDDKTTGFDLIWKHEK